MKIHTLILPDIHGRTFWKEAINNFPIKEYPNINIIFLGDYLDPYELPDEYISRKDAILNFEEIIEVVKNDYRIKLLIGNHDMHYWYDAEYKSRVDNKNYSYISKLFKDNFDMFNIAFEENVNKRKILYTHAGVTRFWLQHLHFIGEFSLKSNIGKITDEQKEYCKFLKNIKPCAEDLNKLKDNFQGQANLWMPSWYRGGQYDSGSCIWADVKEWSYENSNCDDIWQIFGHSLVGGNSLDDALIYEKYKWAMLDSRQAWVLDIKGHLHKYKEYIK